MKVQNFLILLICMTTAMSLAGTMLPSSNASAESQVSTEIVGMPNPWTDQKDMQAAELATGFPFQIPKAIGALKPMEIQTLEQDIIQVFYREEADSEEYVLLRKGFGNQDVSGDYNDYSESAVKMVGDYQVTEQGEDGRVLLATWTKGQFSYSISVPSMTAQEVETIILAMK